MRARRWKVGSGDSKTVAPMRIGPRAAVDPSHHLQIEDNAAQLEGRCRRPAENTDGEVWMEATRDVVGGRRWRRLLHKLVGHFA